MKKRYWTCNQFRDLLRQGMINYALDGKYCAIVGQKQLCCSTSLLYSNSSCASQWMFDVSASVADRGNRMVSSYISLIIFAAIQNRPNDWNAPFCLTDNILVKSNGDSAPANSWPWPSFLALHQIFIETQMLTELSHFGQSWCFWVLIHRAFSYFFVIR